MKSLMALLEERQIRLVIAQVMVDMDPKDPFELQRLVGEEAFYDTLDDVVAAYREATP